MFASVRVSPLHRSFVVALLSAASTMAAGQAQQSSPRNVFWSASDLVQVAANPGAQPAADHAPPNPPKKPAPTPTHTRPHIEPELIAKNGYGEQPQLVRVSQEQIGLRYALLLRDAAGQYNEVSPATIFHSGDHIRVSIMANQPGYLYVIQKGSSGNWTSIYPKKPATPDAAPTNHVDAGEVFLVPGTKSFFRFDQTPGEEKLFLVLSRERIADLDGAIDSFKNGQPSTTPAKPEAAPADGQMLEASNHIPDAFIQKLSSRDLTLVDEETVDQPAQPAQPGKPAQPGNSAPSGSQSAASSGEKAVYVVSKASYTKGESPRVVASLTLRHQ